MREEELSAPVEPVEDLCDLHITMRAGMLVTQDQSVITSARRSSRRGLGCVLFSVYFSPVNSVDSLNSAVRNVAFPAHIRLIMNRILLVSPAIALFLFILMFLCILARPLLAAPAGKTEVFPVQKAAPVAVVIETAGSEAELRRQMRVKNNVAALSTGATRFSEAPIGSFGFIAPQSLGMALVTQSPDLELERVASTSNAYEIHKVADGNGLLVGFMDREGASQISPSERPKNLRIALYSNSMEKAPTIVAIPLSKLMVDRMPTRLDPKKSDSPVLLNMDLLTTANRKSAGGGQ